MNKNVQEFLKQLAAGEWLTCNLLPDNGTPGTGIARNEVLAIQAEARRLLQANKNPVDHDDQRG